MAYERAIAIEPRFASPRSSRGALLALLGREDEALRECELATTLEPTLAFAQANYAAALFDCRRYEEAISASDKALALDPGIEYVEALRVNAKRFLCDWSGFDEEASRLLDGAGGKRPVAMPLMILPVTSSAREQLSCGRLISSVLCPEQPKPLWSGRIYSHD